MENYKKLLAAVSGAVMLAGSAVLPSQAVALPDLFVITQDPAGATSGVFLRGVFSEPGDYFGLIDTYHTTEMDPATAQWWVENFGGGSEVVEGYLPVVSDYDAFDNFGRIYLNDQPNRNWGSTEIRIGNTCTQTADGAQSALSSSLVYTDQLTTVCEGSGTFGPDTVDVRLTQEFLGSFIRWTLEAKSPNGSVSSGLYLFLGGDVGNDKIFAGTGVTGSYYWDTVVRDVDSVSPSYGVVSGIRSETQYEIYDNYNRVTSGEFPNDEYIIRPPNQLALTDEYQNYLSIEFWSLGFVRNEVSYAASTEAIHTYASVPFGCSIPDVTADGVAASADDIWCPFATEPEPIEYNGPHVFNSPVTAGAGQSAVFSGEGFSKVERVVGCETELDFTATAGRLTVNVPAGLPDQVCDLFVEFDGGNVQWQDSLVVKSKPHFWTKRMVASDGTAAESAKLYAKNVVGAGKIQLMLNGKEVAWVNASDATDPKLRTANGANYLVRTVQLAPGKNRLQIMQGGKVVASTVYNR